jgi:glucose-1-phosphate thymidylyltransferase
MKRKGIILAGGSGTRLYPMTRVTPKALLPVYDKPMIYYPLSTLMQAGIREILVITTAESEPNFRQLLGNGSQWGVALSYAVQPKPEGLAQALVIAEPFLAGAPSCLVLGDNLLHGRGLAAALHRAARKSDAGATVFAFRVDDPERYGVVAFDDEGRATSLEEKPAHPKSDWAVIGVYFYDETAPARALGLAPSARGEYEITDLNRTYLEEGTLSVERLEAGCAWFDAGTHESLIEAGEFVRLVQRRQRQLVGAPEEIAYAAGWIDAQSLARQARALSGTDYGRMLMLAKPKARMRGRTTVLNGAYVGEPGSHIVNREAV